ncbi:respiratory chain complex I subunit 1 family protein [methane-oxidizing endosymbiont of Gigantopelta aegis]|uniref:respiratory chain complex I subunit 1 family protein n=1 Tax=methane-oxidizing endosymbiont of Gigantopelta aegis TaxID=2794938 RepID=UPI0018DE69F1|nr:NADH-quinone oxidoreductase subunit H [methane-oxidizing endosymbiont of Gigantopelta aegis]
MNWIFAFIQTLLFIALAPLLVGWVKWWKCRLQNRKAPSLLQPYRDLLKLTHKQPLVSHTASWLFIATPYIVFSAMILAASVVPLISIDLPTAASADVIVLVGFFAFARFFQALAGMDVGTAFGGMGASREMTISTLAEPAMLMAIFTLTMTASSTNLASAIGYVLDQGIVLRPSFVFALFAMILVAIAETGRIPVDNPATHLELTMIHEAMILEYSGRHLALIEWASAIKLMLYGVLISNIFFPWGIAVDFAPSALGAALLWLLLKLAVLAVFLAIAETALAKMRLFRVQEFLSFAYLLGLLGLLSHIILEASR